MSSLSVRTVSRAPVPVVNHASRLELLEYYLVHHEDLVRCAVTSLEWLGRNANIKRCVCLAVEAEASMLVGIAGYGVPAEEVELFSWPLSDAQDPLVAALAEPRPTTFRATRSNGHPSRSAPS